jgi:hypothetical protein
VRLAWNGNAPRGRRKEGNEVSNYISITLYQVNGTLFNMDLLFLS